VFSEGVLFDPEDLDIDLGAYRDDVATAAARARNLSVNATYPTAQTASTLLAKARGDAKSVGLQAAIESPDLADDLVSKVDAQVRALAAQVDDPEALPEDLQDVEAPSAGAETAEDEAEDEEESTTEETDTEADAEDSDDDDDDDEEAGGDALGNMFG